VLTTGGYIYIGFYTSPATIYKVDPTDLAVVDVLTCNSGYSYAVDMCLAGNYLFIAHSLSPARISKIDLTTFTVVGTYIAASGRSNPRNIVTDGAYVYMSCTNYTIKVRISDMTLQGTYSHGLSAAPSLTHDGTYLYEKEGIGTAIIYKIDTASMTVIGTWTSDDASEYGPYAITNDGTHLYCAVQINVPPYTVRIVKVTISTMSTFSRCDNPYTTDLPRRLVYSDGYVYLGSGGGSNYRSIVKFSTVPSVSGYWDDNILAQQITGLFADGFYVYANFNQTWARTVKIDPGTMTTIATFWNAGQKNAEYLVSDGTYLYAGLATNPGKVVKINPSSMAIVGTWFEDFASGKSVAGLAYDGTYLYAALTGTGVQIVKINPDTMTTVSTGNTSITGILNLLSDGTYIYAAGYSSPAMVSKFSPTSMTEISVWTGGAGEDYAYAVAQNGLYIFAILYTSPTQVVKIAKATMTTVSKWTGAAGENNGQAVDASDSFVFAGLYLNPAKIMKLDIASMTTVSVWTGGAGDNGLDSVLCDGVRIFAGLDTNPARIYMISQAMDTIDSYVGAPDERYCYAMAKPSTYLYGALYTSPAIIVKLQIPSAKSIEVGNIQNRLVAVTAI